MPIIQLSTQALAHRQWGYLIQSKSEVWKEKEKVFEPAFYELPSSSYFEINSGTVSEARW